MMRSGRKVLKSITILILTVFITVMLFSCSKLYFLNNKIPKDVLTSKQAGRTEKEIPNRSESGLYIQANMVLDGTGLEKGGNTLTTTKMKEGVIEAKKNGYDINTFYITIYLDNYLKIKVDSNYKDIDSENNYKIKEQSKDFNNKLVNIQDHLNSGYYLGSSSGEKIKYIYEFKYSNITSDKDIDIDVIYSQLEFINKHFFLKNSNKALAVQTGTLVDYSKTDKEKYIKILNKQIEEIPYFSKILVNDDIYQYIKPSLKKNSVGKSFNNVSKKSIKINRFDKNKYQDSRWNLNTLSFADEDYNEKDIEKVVSFLYGKSISYINYSASKNVLEKFKNIEVKNDILSKMGIHIYYNWFNSKRTLNEFVLDFVGPHFVITGYTVEKNKNSKSEADYLKVTFKINNFGAASIFNVDSMLIFRGKKNSYNELDKDLTKMTTLEENLSFEKISSFDSTKVIFYLPKAKTSDTGLGNGEVIGITILNTDKKEIFLYNKEEKLTGAGTPYRKILILKGDAQ